jgi:hypothetical protein
MIVKQTGTLWCDRGLQWEPAALPRHTTVTPIRMQTVDTK